MPSTARLDPPVYCRRCKSEIPTNLRYCGHCGHDQARPPETPRHAPEPLPRDIHQPPVYRAPPKPAPRDLDSAPDYVLAECKRQYQNANVMLVIGAWCSPTLLLIALFVYAIVQRNNIRARVAELGVEPGAWAAPMDKWLVFLCLLPILVMAGGFCLILIIGMLASLRHSAPASDPTPNQNTYYSTPATEYESTSASYPEPVTPPLPDASSPQEQARVNAEQSRLTEQMDRDEKAMAKEQSADNHPMLVAPAVNDRKVFQTPNKVHAVARGGFGQGGFGGGGSYNPADYPNGSGGSGFSQR